MLELKPFVEKISFIFFESVSTKALLQCYLSCDNFNLQDDKDDDQATATSDYNKDDDDINVTFSLQYSKITVLSS